MKLAENPLFQILCIGKTVERMLDQHMQGSCRMSHADARLLMVVGYHPDTTQRELADALQVSTPAISRQVDKLAKEGYLVRTVKPESRRSSQITLTKKGHIVHEQSKTYLEYELDTMLEKAGGATKQTMKNLVTIMNELGKHDVAVSSKIMQGINQDL